MKAKKILVLFLAFALAMQPLPAASPPTCSVQSAALSRASGSIEVTWPMGERTLGLELPTRPGPNNALRDGFIIVTR